MPIDTKILDNILHDAQEIIDHIQHMKETPHAKARVAEFKVFDEKLDALKAGLNKAISFVEQSDYSNAISMLETLTKLSNKIFNDYGSDKFLNSASRDSDMIRIDKIGLHALAQDLKTDLNNYLKSIKEVYQQTKPKNSRKNNMFKDAAIHPVNEDDFDDIRQSHHQLQEPLMKDVKKSYGT